MRWYFRYDMVCSYRMFFFKQKTAYEMRISDWSSDVCSSDLVLQAEVGEVVAPGVEEGIGIGHGRTSLLVTLGPQAEGPEQATERSPWMLGSSPSMTMEAGMTAAQDIAPRHPLCEPGSPLVLARANSRSRKSSSVVRMRGRSPSLKGLSSRANWSVMRQSSHILMRSAWPPSRNIECLPAS